MNVSPTVRRVVGPTILLVGGTYFDFLDPEHSAFTIFDVAHALAHVCRFAGQCARFYSVAQHCVHVSRAVSEANAYAALMHDAAEAFVGDVARPLKDLLPEYRGIEQRVEAAVFDRFLVPRPIPDEVKEADVVLLVTEQRQLMNNRDDWNYTRGRTPLPIMLPVWGPEQARGAFLARFRELCPRSVTP